MSLAGGVGAGASAADGAGAGASEAGGAASWPIAGSAEPITTPSTAASCALRLIIPIPSSLARVARLRLTAKFRFVRAFVVTERHSDRQCSIFPTFGRATTYRCSVTLSHRDFFPVPFANGARGACKRDEDSAGPTRHLIRALFAPYPCAPPGLRARRNRLTKAQRWPGRRDERPT